jgi:hypothetical protein
MRAMYDTTGVPPVQENKRHARLVKKASKLAVTDLLEIAAMRGLKAEPAASSSGDASGAAPAAGAAEASPAAGTSPSKGVPSGGVDKESGAAAEVPAEGEEEEDAADK